MSDDPAVLEQRLTALERSSHRWKATAIALALTVVGVGVAGFRAAQQSQVVETDRIVLRSAQFGGRVELSARLSGLHVQFTGETTARGVVAPLPELRLIDARGREVARLGAPTARPILQ